MAGSPAPGCLTENPAWLPEKAVSAGLSSVGVGYSRFAPKLRLKLLPQIMQRHASGHRNDEDDHGSDSVARLSNAGPGHKPTSPQPIPNNAAPTISGESISRLVRSEEHTSELQSQFHLVCRLLL